MKKGILTFYLLLSATYVMAQFLYDGTIVKNELGEITSARFDVDNQSSYTPTSAVEFYNIILKATHDETFKNVKLLLADARFRVF